MPRHSTRPGLVLLGLALAVAPAAAAPPTVTSLTPHGGQRGQAVDLTLVGANLGSGARLVLPFKAMQQPLPDAKPTPTRARVRLAVDASVPAGIYPVRVVTDDGVSPVLFFHVADFPGVAEVEDNSSLAKAQKVPVPVVIDGQCGGGDVDYFRFAAKKGQRLVLEVLSARLGSGVLPQIHLTDAKGRFLAADDSQALRGDVRIFFVVPADGDYVIEISDSRYRGAAPPHYRLQIADADFAAEVFPLGGRRGDKVEFVLRGGNLAGEVRVARVLTGPAAARHVPLDLGSAVRPGMLPPVVALGELPEQTYPGPGGKAGPMPLTLPVTVNGRLTHKSEVHRFRLAVKAGERYRFAVEADALGSALDGVLRLTDQAGKQLALVDDVDLPPPAAGLQGSKSPDPALDFTVPVGVSALAVELRDGRHRGGVNFGYRLTVESGADFALGQPAAELNLPRGGAVALTVPVARRGYDGPIQLAIPGLPAGLAQRGGYVPAGAGQGTLTLSADPAAKLPGSPLALWLEGKALAPGKDIRRRAEQELVVARDANVAVATVPVREFAVALTSPAPFAVRGPEVVELVNGYPAPVTVTVTRAAGQKVGAVEVTGVSPLAPPAPGRPPQKPALTFKPGSAAPAAGQATFTVTAGPDVVEGRAGDLFVQGKAKVNNSDRTVTGQAVTVTVVRPFRVELLAPEVVLKAGESAVLKGRLVRQPVFRAAVQLKLEGLPKGVTLAAPPRPVPADQAEVALELRVDPKAAPASGKLKLTCTATINGMAYRHPILTVPVRVVPK